MSSCLWPVLVRAAPAAALLPLSHPCEEGTGWMFLWRAVSPGHGSEHGLLVWWMCRRVFGLSWNANTPKWDRLSLAQRQQHRVCLSQPYPRCDSAVTEGLPAQQLESTSSQHQIILVRNLFSVLVHFKTSMICCPRLLDTSDWGVVEMELQTQQYYWEASAADLRLPPLYD